MTAREPLRLVPRLRFPEFKTRGGWPLTTLAEVLEEHGLKSDGTSEVYSVSLAKGIVPQVEHMGRSFAARDTAHYNLVRPFDVVYTRSPLADFKLGIVKQHRSDHNAIVSPLYGVFAPKSPHVGMLIEAFLENPARAFSYLDPLAQKGAKNTIQLSNERFLSGAIYLPDDEDEQKKVADLLGSLDDLIALEGRKLEALRLHQTALMQQLFPRPGESLPRLRFPEFEDDTEWDHDVVGELIETVAPPKKLKTSDYLPSGRFPIIDQSQNAICGWTDDEDAVITRPLPVVVFGDHTCSLKLVERPFAQGADGIKILTAGSRVTVAYLFHYLSCRPLVTERYKRHFADLQERVVLFPVVHSGEQQRIADCLSTLVALIASQSQILEALSRHRQGLLHQLFPSLAEKAQ